MHESPVRALDSQNFNNHCNLNLSNFQKSEYYIQWLPLRLSKHISYQEKSRHTTNTPVIIKPSQEILAHPVIWTCFPITISPQDIWLVLVYKVVNLWVGNLLAQHWSKKWISIKQETCNSKWKLPTQAYIYCYYTQFFNYTRKWCLVNWIFDLELYYYLLVVWHDALLQSLSSALQKKTADSVIKVYKVYWL